MANNSISKNSDKFGAPMPEGIGEGYMWSSDEFKSHLSELTGRPDVWEKQIQPMMKRIVVSHPCLLYFFSCPSPYRHASMKPPLFAL